VANWMPCILRHCHAWRAPPPYNACGESFRWSAEYVLLRGLGHLDVFPGDDVGARNTLQRLLAPPSGPGYIAMQAITAAWAPTPAWVFSTSSSPGWPDAASYLRETV